MIILPYSWNSTLTLSHGFSLTLLLGFQQKLVMVIKCEAAENHR